ncbi:MAG: argininosuccinate lyase [Bacteroidetes bacterium]|nr:argininosuccinate lyase [Bacteroidota bacterium]
MHTNQTAQRLWQKTTDAHPAVVAFTAGDDRAIDARLAPFDIQGSLAHCTMLHECGLIDSVEFDTLQKGLHELATLVQQTDFALPHWAEDIHSFVEMWLTEKYGEAGKKLHTARSRNDQVMTGICLYTRHALGETAEQIAAFATQLLQLAHTHAQAGMPGYTHFQAAMPSSFGLWFAAWAEALSEDLIALNAAFELASLSPLGAGAGYGSAFPINRERTAELLGFDGLHVNVINAQLTRGKTERAAADALAAVGITLSRLSADCCLFMSTNYGFIRFPDELTTGSSLMPHKKNPDVFELVRARCNALQAVPQQLALLTCGMPSGYHRDFQLTKQLLFPAFDTINQCISMLSLMFTHIEVKQHLLNDEKYKAVYTVDALYALTQQGVPFRDAYKEIGMAVQNGTFELPELPAHTLTGSKDNLSLELIENILEKRMKWFNEI